MPLPEAQAQALFSRFQQDFLGLDRRIYLDAAATSLMPRVVLDGLKAYYEQACANPHTSAHLGGRATTSAIEHTRELVSALFGADPSRYAVLFCGNGSTDAINRVSSAIFAKRSDRPLVVLSMLEHHSDMLPWIREAGGRKNIRFFGVTEDGSPDLQDLARVLSSEGRRVRVVAVTAASNVTGVILPIHQIAKMAHAVGALCCVDGAQAAPHLPIQMASINDDESIDALAISGHKLYAPGSPGVLLCRRDLFPGSVVGDVGGGTVDSVSLVETVFKPRLEDREEAGTPNFPGVIALGIVAKILGDIGMDRVWRHDADLTRYALGKLVKNENVVVYGPKDLPRVGTISFNLRTAPHGLVATVLSDRFGIAVRNECFCAQPYVRRLVTNGPPVVLGCTPEEERRPGMVRVSFGLYTSRAHIDALVDALEWISNNVTVICDTYDSTITNEWKTTGQPHPTDCFSIDRVVQQYETPGLSLVGPSGELTVSPTTQRVLKIAPYLAIGAAVTASYLLYRRLSRPG